MRLSRLPLRIRLVAGFVSAMIVVLIAAGGYVFWRVQFALDNRLNQDLDTQTSDLQQAATRLSPSGALRSLRDEAREAQLLDANGLVLASGPGIDRSRALLTAPQAREAERRPLKTGHGYLFSKRGEHLRILAVPVHNAAARVAVTAVRLSQRDEALRELLAQLAIANLAAAALASLVGYRLARAALDPVERYRAQAEQITLGAPGVRLQVPDDRVDEITRLGTTLNTMLDAQQRAADRQQQFIDDASHELRTPLTTLSAEIDVALRKPRSAAEYERALQRLSADTSQLIELAETLLALGALGSSTPRAQDVPAVGALVAAARRARGQLSDDDVVTTDAPDNLLVHANPALLTRALGNLVDNASRYGRSPIALSARHQPLHTGSATVLTVHDDGDGIPARFLAHAAERFRQHETSRSGPGVGLGLSMVDAIVTAHHGQMRICANGQHHQRSTASIELAELRCAHPDSGATITLLLPDAVAWATRQ